MLLDAILRYLRKITTMSFFIFWLLAGVVLSIAYGLADLIRGLDVAPMLWLSFAGLTLAWFLARSRLNQWLAAILLSLFGIGLTFIWVGELLAPLVNLSRALIQAVWSFLQRPAEFTLDPTSINLAYAEISLGVKSISAQLQKWLQALTTDRPVFRAAAVSIVWGSIIWITAVWTGWVYRRHDRAFISILPGSVLLVVVMSYTYADTMVLYPLLLCILMLIAISWLNLNETRWKSEGVDYPDDVKTDSIFAFVSISLLLVSTGFFMPHLSVRQLVEAIREYTHPQIQQASPVIESLGIEPYQPSIGRFAPMLSGGLPRSHLIGAGPELSQQVVMSVQITDGLPTGVDADPAIPLYWRGLTYDQYTGTGWDSSTVSLRHYRSNQQVAFYDRPGYWIIEQEFRFVEDSDLMYAAGDLISTNQNFRVAWRSEPRHTEIEQFPGDFFGALTDRQRYQALSFVPVIDESSLRTSPEEYPEWVQQTYLTIPEMTPRRVVNLARDLVEGINNPYDRAETIEGYLRQFEYTTDLPSPPADRDVVDYFLFDLQRGYCDYFASSMVVLARAVDLPARLVIGYSRGTFDPANDRYVVTEAQAHSWPEIYFSGVGWVPFEPTAGRKQIVRSQTPLEFPGDPVDAIEPESIISGIQPLLGSWRLTAVIIFFVVILAGTAWLAIDEWMLKRLSPPGIVTRLFDRLYSHGRRLGAPAKKQDTPDDFASSLQQQLARLGSMPTGGQSMRMAQQGVVALTGMYTRALFSQQSLPDDRTPHVLSTWKNLRWLLRWARILYWMQRFKPTGNSAPGSDTME